MKNLTIRGAREHNLADIDVELPHRAVIAVTGVSGSGKSSLAFDTIFAEGQRRYIESLSTYARQFIERLDRPDLDSIDGISPTIAIRQKNTVTSARSTVGTATEIYDYLRLLYARAGRTVCPDCGVVVRSWTPTDIAAETTRRLAGRRLMLLIPGEPLKSSEWKQRRSYLLARGYTRVLAGGEPIRIEDYRPAKRGSVAIDVLIDRITGGEDSRSRVAEAAETAYGEPEGTFEIEDADEGGRMRFTSHPACPSCGRTFEKPSPLLFSFNSPYGACPECRGFGDRMEFADYLIVPDPNLSLSERAIDPWSRERFEYFQDRMIRFCRRRGIPVDVPWRAMSGVDRRLILEGEGKGEDGYIGVIPFLERMKEKNYKKGHRFFTRRYMGYTTCRACRGTRLRLEAQYVLIGDRSIGELAAMVPAAILECLGKTDFDEAEARIARDLLVEIRSRLGFMIDVGLGYLTLSRLTRTLSGGEAQRINLAGSLGANLVDTLYVLDEPSVGLHPADTERLVMVMRRLRDMGNTVIVVEHDPDIIRSADHLLDLGPGPGRDGGRVLFNGPLEDAKTADVPDSATIQWVFGAHQATPLRAQTRAPAGLIELRGVSHHNLREVEVDIPLGQLVCVTGVSGSGKSTLVVDVLYELLSHARSAEQPPSVRSLRVDGKVDKVLLIDQSPIGASPRSNPVTYIKGFSFIRQVFAEQHTARARGYQPGRFSFNKAGGRCARCEGMGYRRVEMHFMADVFVPCEECGGKRYNRETLEIEYHGRTIADVLEMTVDEAIMFFDEVPQLGEKLWVLARTGLGYLRLGQPSNTLSGGEAQRIKIARELAESGGRRNLYIMDEPTTGLHMSDVDRLLGVIDELLAAGHSVVTIEHNLAVVARSDTVIDLGPGGGDDGGRVIACGPPRSILQSKGSVTGRYLKRYLETYGRAR